jgi:15-cis-phytoene synthase
MSLNACAEIVKRGDPDRFLATMAAPAPARAVLFPLYAFNLEVARAPWMASEPIMAEMRLQFWRDVAADMAAGKPPRAHEVAAPLAAAIPPECGDLLEGLVAARWWDISRCPFEDAAHFDAYINATSGNLVWAGALALGAAPAAEAPIRALGFAAGIAGLLRAVPDLEARKRVPLLDGTAQGVRDLAERGLAKWAEGRATRARIARPARPVLLALWRTRTTLMMARDAPERVIDAMLDESEFSRRGRLLWAQVKGGI